MAWSDLTNNELPSHSEVAQGVAAGDLRWLSGNPGLPSGECYTREMYEQYVQHKNMGSSGIALNDYMTKGEMIQYALHEVPGFHVVQNYDLCPFATRAEVRWNGGTIELSYRIWPTGNWISLGNPTVSPYIHNVTPGSYEYRAVQGGATSLYVIHITECPALAEEPNAQEGSEGGEAGGGEQPPGDPHPEPAGAGGPVAILG